MDITHLEKKVTDLYIQYNSVKSSYQTTLDSLRELTEEQCKLSENKALLEKSKPFIDDLIDKFSESSIKKLEDLLSLGLRRIFQDRDYRVEIKVTEKRSSKCADL